MRATRENHIEPSRQIGHAFVFRASQLPEIYTGICERKDRRYRCHFQRWLTLQERFDFADAETDREGNSWPAGPKRRKARAAQQKLKRLALKRRDAEFRDMFDARDFGLGDREMYDRRFWKKAKGVTFNSRHEANRGAKRRAKK